MTALLTTAPMSWPGPDLGDEARDLLGMLDALATDRGCVLEDDPELVAGLVGELGELGVWTLGLSEDLGGGGADHATTVVAWERLGRYWPALGWASVQAHAALLALGTALPDVAATWHGGRGAVAVALTSASHVRLEVGDTGVTGSVDRIDAAHESPHLLVVDRERCLLVGPEHLTHHPLERTGLLGALTRAVTVSATPDAGVVTVLHDADAQAVRSTLWLGAGAVAAGIAGAAADTALGYTGSRHQFGGPLRELPTVRRSVIDQEGWVSTALAAVIGSSPRPAAAHAVMRRLTDGAIDVAAAALQTHGGYGYLTEYPVERYLRDAVSLRAATHAPEGP